MSIFHKLLSLASLIPGPQQPFVAGASLLGGIGENAYNRAHGDSDYRKMHPAFDIGEIGQQGFNMLTQPADPLRQLLMRLHGGGAGQTMGPGDFPMGGPYRG